MRRGWAWRAWHRNSAWRLSGRWHLALQREGGDLWYERACAAARQRRKISSGGRVRLAEDAAEMASSGRMSVAYRMIRGIFLLAARRVSTTFFASMVRKAKR